MDEQGFSTLNPSASARSDAESFMAEYLGELIQSYRDLRNRYDKNFVEFKRFRLGDPFYQYKGFSSFKDSEVTIEVDGVEESFMITKIVRIADRWLIISLGAEEY